MYSTSSSECNYYETFGYGINFPNILGNAFCATTQQPLIYYAKIQEPFQQVPNSGNANDQTNYFMKALQWYTQERGSSHKDGYRGSSVNNDDFAAWLDKQYNEYLKSNQHDGPQFIVKETPNTESDNMTKKKKSSRKFGRMRSPWKWHRHTCSKEEGDVPTTNQSVQYLLQPKDLHKHTSDCCQKNPCKQTNATIESKESGKCEKIKVKSKSLLCIYRAQGESDNAEAKTKSHVKHVCECVKKNIGSQYEGLSLEALMLLHNYNTKTQEFDESNLNDVATQKVKPQRRSRTNVSCQCLGFDFGEAHGSLPINKYGNRQDWHVDNDEGYLSKTPKTTVMFTGDPEMNIPKVQTLSAQTSDQSINLANMFYDRPILLKVVEIKK